MPGNRRAQQVILVGIVQILPDVPLVKQDFGAHGGMVDGLGIVEGAVLPQLLKAAHIVQKTAQPGKVFFLQGKSKAGGNAFA